MNRRHFLIGGATIAAGAASYKLGWLESIKKDYANVLMLIVDDLNDWVGPLNGHPNAKTPNIDRLAAKGTVFSNAHAPAPLCGPSRASIMTGLLPSTTGIYGHIADNDIKRASDKAATSTFMSEYFKQHGYYTAAVGKVFHHGAPTGSFDTFGGRAKGFGPYPEQNMKWDHPRTNTDWGAFPERDEQMPDWDTAHWLKDQLNTQHDKPFFIAGGFLRPHAPWHVPKKWFDMHPIGTIKLPPYLENDMDDIPDMGKIVSALPQMPTTQWAQENDEWRYIVQAYLASVSFVDNCVGIVLDALENSAYANDTAVVLWGDHGYQLGEKSKFAKMALWERATRTPLIITPPKSYQKKTKSVASEAVSLLDLYPTLTKMCGLPPNKQNQGNDISPLMEANDIEWDNIALTTYGPNNHAVKTGRYRYIQYEDGSEELYDHKTDTNEWHNLANDTRYTDVKAQLKQRLPSENAKWSPLTAANTNDYFHALTKKYTDLFDKH